MGITTWERAIGTAAVRVSGLRAQRGEKAMKHSAETLRDMMFVYAMYIAFRAMVLLRRCNY